MKAKRPLAPSNLVTLKALAGVLAMGLLVACSGSPTNDDATLAVKQLLLNGGKFADIALPESVGVRSVKIGKCVDAEPLDGQYCDINIVSEEVPVLGAIVIPLTVRFAKRPSGWEVFLN